MLQYYTMEGENGLKKSAGNLYLRIAAKKYEKFPSVHGDETQESWKPLLNTIYVFRGSSECFAQ